MFPIIAGIDFSVIPSSTNIQKIQKQVIMPTRVDARPKIHFSVQKSSFLCNTNRNYFHDKNMTSC